MNDTELKLGRRLVYEIRQVMSYKDVRQVYIPGARREMGAHGELPKQLKDLVGSKQVTRQQAADALLLAGHPVQAVADALGVSRRTLYNWELTSTRGIGAEAHVEDREIADLDDAQLLQGVYAVAAATRKRASKKKLQPRLGNDAAKAAAKLAKALNQDEDKMRRRCAAAAVVLHDMRDLEITQ